MKRLIPLLLACCLLLPTLALAEGKDDYGMYQAAREQGDEALMAEIRVGMPSRLYPAQGENGKWGYIDRVGEWAIPPQYDFALYFRGSYAAAGFMEDENDSYHGGIIDREGNWVVPPEYFVDEGYDGWTYGGLDTGMYQVWGPHDEHGKPSNTGFFDVPSGCFSGLILADDATWWSQEPLVPVTLADGREVYMDRRDGSIAFEIPEGYEYDWLSHDSDFHNGFALLYAKEGEQDCIINEKGEILDLPDSLSFGADDLQRFFGLMLCYDTETELYGYWDLNAMEWRVPPRYDFAGAFSRSGYACVSLPGDKSYGHIDTEGSLIASGFSEAYAFLGDYAFVAGEPGLLIDAAGEVVLALPGGAEIEEQWDDDLRDGWEYYVSPDGLMVISLGMQGEGIMNLEGEWILPPLEGGKRWVYSRDETFFPEGWRFFSEGYQAVQQMSEERRQTEVGPDGNIRTVSVYDWKIAYINTQGEFVTDFVFDTAGAFLDGLAWVQRGEEVGYIDAFGHDVYFWKEELEWPHG